MGNNVLGANRLGERLSNPGSMPELGGGNQIGGNQNTDGLISGMIGNMPPSTPQLPPTNMPDLGGMADKLRDGMGIPPPNTGGGGGVSEVGGGGNWNINRNNGTSKPISPMGAPGMPIGGMSGGNIDNPVAKQPMRRMPRQQPNQEAGRRRISMF